MVDRKVVRMDRLEEEHVVDLDLGLLVPFYPTPRHQSGCLGMVGWCLAKGRPRLGVVMDA
ncbi:hypothetical protein PIB30_092596 [Stylosanthes scabra]|uniref:Uncharacterized protein n=1 Tax=Stylosanthes scabra TaxID=79078 RepID=A0ABU6UTP0_9FABA|nr:hypothetical protein [Stylosanthes scabra]